MKARLSLRIAAIIMFLHDVGHTIGALTWKQAKDPAQQEVISQMTGKKFPFMGATKSMGDYYEGYGFASTLALLLIAGILWIISNANEQTKQMCRQIAVLMAGILLLWGIVELIYFFPFAASFSFISSVLVFYSITKLNRL